jgi:hypothetical protein
MRTLIFLAALVLSPAAQAQSLSSLHWLKGCWRSVGDGPVITEVWSAPPIPAMFGYSYTVGEGQTQGWEAMRIEMIDDAPVFVGMPSGADAVRFPLSEQIVRVSERGPNGGGAIFENAEHDYPQRIAYRRDGNRLTAVVSKIDGTDAITYEYRRILCPRDLAP